MIAFAALQTRTMSVIRNHDPLDEGLVPAPGSIATAVIEAMNCLDCGILLVDGDCRVHFASTRAQQLLSGELYIQGGLLRAKAISEMISMRRLVTRCAHLGQLREADPACCRVGELLLQVAPLAARPPEGMQAEGNLVAVYVIDPACAADPGPEQLRLQFGLTAAEAAVTCEIIKGIGVEECASRIGISITTARTHLHRIFEKTGTRRQAELVRKVLAARPVIR